MSKPKGPKPIVVLGVDPGLRNTGVAVCVVYPSGRIKLIYCGILRTSSKMDNKARYAIIRSGLRDLLEHYNVTTTVCEAFESQPWKGAQRSSVPMSKLINEISEEVYSFGSLFVLSSPSQKSNFEGVFKQAATKIEELPKTHRPHATDAVVHIVRLAERGMLHGP